LLEVNAAKPAREFGGRGYDGRYDALRRYARRWAKQHGQATAAAYVPLSFAPSEAYQFDWSHEVVLLTGVTVIVKVARVQLWPVRVVTPPHGWLRSLNRFVDNNRNGPSQFLA
jgi:hypothetical protein